MKRILFLLLTITAFSPLFSAEITVNQAKNVAKTYYKVRHNIANRSSVQAQLAFTETFTNKVSASKNAFYVFNMAQSGGFMIVAADDKIIPVLAYTDEGNFDINNLPRGVKKLFFEYKKGIAQIVNDDNIQPTSAMANKWQALKMDQFTVSANRATSVAPLMTTKWSQRPNYNLYAPDGAPTGCVATAVAQVLKYHNHPAKGIGSHSYNHNDYGTISANFGATTYDWANMPDKLFTSTSDTAKEAVSKLMHHVGIAVEMNFTPNSSSASSSDVPDALKNYFGYDNTISMKSRSSYSLNGWKNLMKNELDAGRVVYHRGYCPDPKAGHAFVVDGYDTTGKFHLNWGWSGSYNGYFEINNLNPGSTYTWNSGQGAIVGIQPKSTVVDLKIFSNLNLTPSQIDFNQPFSLDVDVANYGGVTYNGRVRASIYDTNDNFIGHVQTINGVSILSNDYGSYTFSTTGMSVSPGVYKIGIYADLGNNQWQLIDEDSFINPIDVTVSSTNNLGLISNGTILVNPDPIKQNLPFTVEIDVINTGTTAFSGDISVDLHNIDSNNSWIDELDHVTRTIAPGATENIVISHPGLANDPGTYKLIIWHKDSGASWEIIQEGTYPNSKIVDLTGLDKSANFPDPYENNDSIDSAYLLPLNYVNNYAIVSTSGADIHLVGDEDFFKVHLDSGYDYLVYARMYDNYNDGGGTYTNDLMFNYYVSGDAGNYYDDAEMPSIVRNAVPTAGEDFVFELLPFYEEDIGTYRFEIEVIRVPPTTSIVKNLESELNIYPNPTNGIVNINNTNYTTVSVISLNGQVLKTITLNQTLTSINTSDLDAGLYLLNFVNENEVLTKRLEVIK